MKIDTNRKGIAGQLAGCLPEGAEVIGLVTESTDHRTQAALVRLRSGIYVTQLGGAVRTCHQGTARAALAYALIASGEGRPHAAGKDDGHEHKA